MKTLYFIYIISLIIKLAISISIQPSLFCTNNCSCDTEKYIVTCNNPKFEKLLNSTEYWQDTTTNELYPFYKVSIINSGIGTLSTFPNSSLKILDLSKNRIQVIDDATFQNLQNMTELDLSDNILTSELLTPDIFKGLYAPDGYLPLKSLKVLNLANNELHTLHQDLFEHIMNLEILNLHGNPLRVLDMQTVIAISGLMYLRELDLSYTFLKKIPDNIFHTPKNLEKLDLSGNLLNYVPTEQLADARNLRFLSLNENPIQNITRERGFPRLEKLKILHLCYLDDLAYIQDDSMAGLWSLEELYISNNVKLYKIGDFALRRIDNEVPVWPKVTKLHLNNNHLSTIPNSFLAHWELLTDLNINDNYFVCDCDTQWMINTLVPIINKVKENGTAIRLHCAAPPELENTNMFEIYEKNETLRCSDTNGGRPERDAGILIGILIGLLLGIPMVLLVLFCYKRNFFGFCNTGPAAFSRKFYNPATMEDEFA